MKPKPKLGVSPAFFISKFDFDFDAERAISMLPLVAKLGYGAVQGEIAAPRFVTAWIDGGIETFGAAARQHGLEVRQFVAHYLLERATGLFDTIDSGDQASVPLAGITADLRAIAAQLASLPRCEVLTIPVGPSAAGPNGGGSVDDAAWLSDLVATLLPELPEALKIAVEALPGSPIATPETMARWLAPFPPERVGVNLDTGHLWSQGIAPEEMVYALGGRRIFGTHICDNDGVTNDSYGPGRGTIDWPRFFYALEDVDYEGPFDLEIRVAEDQIEDEYTVAGSYIASLLRDLYVENRQIDSSRP